MRVTVWLLSLFYFYRNLLQAVGGGIQSGDGSPQIVAFDPLDPEWPVVKPIVRNDCKVKFREKEMSLCHITPWPNFGDELGPPVVKRILELHFQCSAEDIDVFNLRRIYRGGGDNGFLNRTGSNLTTCLMTVGSLWRMIKSGDHVWGTGVAYDGTVKNRCKNARDPNMVKSVTVYSSRGPLSAVQVQKYCSLNANNVDWESSDIESAGDAGFLVPFIFPEFKVKKVGTEEKKRCIIPHKKDEQNSAWRKDQAISTEELKVGIGWVNMTLRLQSCDEVVSSSLHGIILSEALGIANRRLRLSKEPGDFKFSDFYMSFRGEEPEPVKSMESAFIGVLPPLSYSERESYAKRVLKTFPLHLFHAVST